MKENKKLSEKIATDTLIKFIILGLMALFLCAAVLNIVVSRFSAAAEVSAQAARPQGSTQITVSAQVMQKAAIQQIVRLNGDVTPQTEVGIFPDTAGKVSRLLKSVGDTVVRGEVIAYIDPSRAGAAFSQNPVTATVAGTITALAVATGETVGTSTRIATIGSLGSLKITIYVAEKYSAYLRRGLPAVVSFSAAPGERFSASVVTVSPVVNSSNRTIETELTLLRSDPRVKPGMFANVDLVIREKTNTFVLPKNAVKNYNDEYVVYKIDEATARRTVVTTGLSNDLEIEILTGIEEGDKVIIAGAVTDSSLVREASSFAENEESSVAAEQ
jgi:multidrug efflux pump subunit AcrA (membrane-fusion protein)